MLQCTSRHFTLANVASRVYRPILVQTGHYSPIPVQKPAGNIGCSNTPPDSWVTHEEGVIRRRAVFPEYRQHAPAKTPALFPSAYYTKAAS